MYRYRYADRFSVNLWPTPGHLWRRPSASDAAEATIIDESIPKDRHWPCHPPGMGVAWEKLVEK